MPSMKDRVDKINWKMMYDPKKVTEIISSKSITNWAKLHPLTVIPNRIDKSLIPIDFKMFRLLSVTSVAPGVKVVPHSHDEPVFRFFLKGSVLLNGVKYEEGDWILIPEGVEYELTTEDGYTALVDYGVQCGAPHNGDVLSPLRSKPEHD
ncbi:cupin domain-containing protein [Enterobacter ludwigii]